MPETFAKMQHSLWALPKVTTKMTIFTARNLLPRQIINGHLTKYSLLCGASRTSRSVKSSASWPSVKERAYQITRWKGTRTNQASRGLVHLLILVHTFQWRDLLLLTGIQIPVLCLLQVKTGGWGRSLCGLGILWINIVRELRNKKEMGNTYLLSAKEARSRFFRTGTCIPVLC